MRERDWNSTMSLFAGTTAVLVDIKRMDLTGQLLNLAEPLKELLRET